MMTLDEAIKYCAEHRASCQKEKCAGFHLQLETWLTELQDVRRHGAGARAREAAQLLIEEIGASGPESIVETAQRAVEKLRRYRGVTKGA